MRRKDVRLGVTVLAVVAVSLIAWLGMRDDRGSTPVAAPAVTVIAAAPAPAASVAVEPVQATGQASPETDEVQICGGAWVKAGADGQVDSKEAEAVSRGMLETTRAPTLAAMEASADERVQAAAHFYRYNLDRAFEACREGTACTRRTEAQSHAADAERTALVRLAQSSTDPQIYAWAYRSCSDPAPGSKARASSSRRSNGPASTRRTPRPG
jgi:hypothetical protein